MKKFFKVMTLSAAMGMFGLNQANAEYDPNLKSIDTPPAVSQQMFNKVKSNGLGQYAYAKGLSSKFIESEGVKLHYVEGGSKGTPIVFIHGFGSTWKMWEPVMLSYMKDHKVIAIDLV